MMSKKINLIIGSTRQGRVSRTIADKLVELAADEGIQLGLYDLKEINLPLFDAPVSPMYKPTETKEGIAWQDKIKDSDGLVFLTSEYNRSIPSSLKNAIDYLYAEWNDKPATIVSYGYIDGGMSATNHLRDILSWVKVKLDDNTHSIKFAHDTFDESGNFKDIDTTLAPLKEGFINSLKSL